MPTNDKKAKDPYVEAQIERTLAPYKGIATPAMLETMREELEEMLTTDPNAVALLNRLREAGAPLATTERLREGVLPEDVVEEKTGGGKEGA